MFFTTEFIEDTEKTFNLGLNNGCYKGDISHNDRHSGHHAVGVMIRNPVALV